MVGPYLFTPTHFQVLVLARTRTASHGHAVPAYAPGKQHSSDRTDGTYKLVQGSACRNRLQEVLIGSNSIIFCQFQKVLARTRMASRSVAVSAHAPGNEDSPDDTAGVHDDWLMVLLAETGSYRFV